MWSASVDVQGRRTAYFAVILKVWERKTPGGLLQSGSGDHVLGLYLCGAIKHRNTRVATGVSA
jgi:hypothetical protein